MRYPKATLHAPEDISVRIALQAPYFRVTGGFDPEILTMNTNSVGLSPAQCVEARPQPRCISMRPCWQGVSHED